MKSTAKNVDVVTTKIVRGFSLELTEQELYFLRWCVARVNEPVAPEDCKRLQNMRARFDELPYTGSGDRDTYATIFTK